MKKILLLIFAFTLIAQSFGAAFTSTAAVKASDILLPVGNTGQTISLLDLSTISAKDLQALTGRKMSLFDKLAFKIEQRKLRNSINDDGTVNNKAVAKWYHKDVDNNSGFNFGGFALGLLLGLIGVLIAYLIGGDNRRNRTKWAWIGLGVWIVIWLIFFL